MLTASSSTWTVQPFQLGALDRFARLREFLIRSRFTEPELCQRLEIDSIYDFRAISEGRPPTPELTDPQALLIRLFLDTDPVEWSVVRSLLSRSDLETIEALGLLHTPRGHDEQCAATVMLYPTESLYIASDRRQDPDQCAIRPPADVVYPAITRNTQRFMSMLPRTPCDSFLDLCAGTGIAALVAARQAAHAWAVDITERATRFAHFNARLNEIGNVTALEGDLYDPVADRTFDRIVAHPPYMPAFQQEYAYRDGGEDGEQITRRIIAGLPDHLRPGGRFYCNCLATDRKDAPLETRIREMLGAREGEFDVVVAQAQLFDPTLYYAKVAAEGSGKFASVEQRHQMFKRLGIEQLVFGTLVIQRKRTARPAFTVRRQLARETAARDFEWLLRWETAAAEDPETPRGLIEARPVANPLAELRLVHRIRDGRWVVDKCWVATHLPFALEAACPVWAGALVAQCDGTATVREHLQHLKEKGAVPPEASEEQFVAMVRKMIAGGFLEVEGFPLPPIASPGEG